MSRRAEQIASIMHRAVQQVISDGLSDPRLQGIITVTSAKVDEDLSQCVMGISVMPEQHESKVIHALNDAANHIRRKAGDMVEIHRAPRLVFKIDRSAKRQAAVMTALADISREAPPTTGDTTATPPSSVWPTQTDADSPASNDQETAS